METLITHEYAAAHPACTCVYGLPGIKRDCVEHGHLIRSTEEREGLNLETTKPQKTGSGNRLYYYGGIVRRSYREGSHPCG